MNNTTKIPLKSSIFPKNPEKRDFSVQTNQNKSEIPCRLKNPCQGCGGSQGIVTEVDRSTGNPHHFRLDCRDCGRFQRWVGPREFDRKMGGQNNA